MPDKSKNTIRKNTISRVAVVTLPVFGVWPEYVSCAIICRVFWLVTLAFIMLCHIRYFMSHMTAERFYDLVDCLCSFLAHVKVIMKFVMFWINERKLLETIALMGEDWTDQANNNEISIRTMMRKAKLSDRVTNAIVTLHTVAIVLYCTGLVIADVDVSDETVEVIYINKLDLPFPVNTKLMYKSVLISEYLHMIVINWGAGLANAILMTLVLHASGQIDILQCWLSKLASQDPSNEQEPVTITAKKIIQKHQKIIDFSENIEILYTHIALCMFASNMIMICSLGFIIVTAIGTPDATEQIVKSILFYTSTNIEAFVFCYAGEYLSNKSEEIGFAAYNSAWYNLKTKESRNLLLIILRSQKQLTLTAGNMMDLSLESFASIMNASGSYLSVLLATQ